MIGIDGNEANILNRVGVNQYAFDLLTALAKVPGPHHFVVYLKNPPLSDMPPIGPSWKYRIIPFPKFWTQTRLPWDLFTHFPRPEVFFTPSHYAPRFSPVPTVISIMDLGFLNTPEQFTKQIYRQLQDWTSYSIKNAKKVIAISRFTKTDIIRVYQKDSSDVIVSYPGFDRQHFKPIAEPQVLAKYQITKPYFIFLSSLKPSKNVEGLVRAFARVKSDPRFSEYQLVIAGKKAWMYDRIFALVKELNLGKEVIFTGFIPETDAPGLLSHAAAFVMPSFFEGFGIPVLEALACGIPVVISDVASLPEVAGRAGFYVDPHDPGSIASGMKLALNPSKRKAVLAAAKEQLEKFNWQTTAREVISVLESAKD